MIKAEQRFSSISSIQENSSREDNWARIESLINHTWQIWCLFSRQLIMTSALGGATRNGICVPPCVTPSDWTRVSYIANCAASGNPAKFGKTNSLLRKEPTWGNVDKLVDIINGLNTANKQALLSALSIAARSSDHMQIIRNCTAHLCGETFSLVRDIRPYYNVHILRHPCDAVFWVDPNNGLHAFISWLDDMRQAADAATS